MAKPASFAIRSLRSVAAALRGAATEDRHRYDALKPRRPKGTSRALAPAGREASSPEEIPAKGWLEIAKRTAKKFSDNELMSEAASVTFFALLSLFPAVTAIVSIYGLFNDPSTINGHLDAVSGFVPGGGMEIVRDQVKRLTETPASGLSVGALVGILTALWSANQGAKAMLSALNDVYGEKEDRGFVRKTATSLAFTLGGIACLIVAASAIGLLPLALQATGLSGVVDIAAKAARWPILLIGLMAVLSLLYKFGPSRNTAQWRWVTWGGAIGALSWIGLSAGFSWYVEHFGHYNKTYGSLGAIIGFMTWIWLSCTVILLGAQINAEMETQTGRDTTTGAEKPVGSRGASAADSVA